MIPTTPTFTSDGFLAIASYATDIRLLLVWGVGAILAVVAISLLIKMGRKIARKFNP